MPTMTLDISADEAFRQAGPRCFVNEHARTVYVVAWVGPMIFGLRFGRLLRM